MTSDGELQTLMHRALGGDSLAYRELLTLLSDRFRSYFRTRLGRIGLGVVEAEDLVQETILAIHLRRHTYETDAKFAPWAFSIARYKLIDYLRTNRRRAESSFDEVAGAEVAGSLQESLAEIESSIDIATLLSRLPRRAQDAVRLIKLEGLSVAQVAERLGMSESAVKVTVHRGVKALAAVVR